jgi:hypothetical protein
VPSALRRKPLRSRIGGTEGLSTPEHTAVSEVTPMGRASLASVANMASWTFFASTSIPSTLTSSGSAARLLTGLWRGKTNTDLRNVHLC